LFGFITANADAMNDDQRARYRAWYCGLCKSLSQQHGTASRLTLNYDMTFLVMLLSSVYKTEPQSGSERCAAHPLKKHDYRLNEFSTYAADMNVLLVYHNLMDDWQDDRSVKSLAGAKVYKNAARRAADKYPRQSQAILDGLNALAAAESSCELNPDVPADAFGSIMSALFALRDDEHAAALGDFGSALGRFIYIMDACVDFESDVRHMRYNPLTAMTRADFEPTLTMLAAECTAAFEQLAITSDRDIMENILYSGMWSRFRSEQSEMKKKKRKNTKKEVLSEQ